MDSSLLEPSADDVQRLMQRLTLETDGSIPSPAEMEQSMDGVKYKTLVPKPGFCVKTKTDKNEKVFINVCVSENVPEPKDMSEADLIKLLESDDPTGFRVPMSIGEPHAEMDKSGAGCTAYDVIIHTSFLKKLETSKIFQAFFIQVTREGIETKYDVQLNSEYVVLKNRKSVGKLLEQNVRTQSKPFIMDMGEHMYSHTVFKQLQLKNCIKENKEVEIYENKLPVFNESPGQEQKPLIEEVKKTEVKKGPEPKFTIVQEPAVGHPDFLVAEVHLPQVKTATSLTLDVGEDRIVLDTRSNVYYLDIYLPYYIVQEEVGSQFHRKSKILTITMPVQPQV